MDFELSDEQQALRDAGRKLLASLAPLSRTRAISESGDGFDRAAWRKGADLGWPALALDEQHGGFGQGLADLAIVSVDHGRFVLPSPFIPTVVVADALATADAKAYGRTIEALGSGDLTAAWAVAESGDSCGDAVPSSRAAEHGDGYRLSGAKALVQDAGSADVLLVDAALDGERARFLVPASADGITIRRVAALDITRELDDVGFADVLVDPDALIARGDAAVAGWARSLARTTVLLCAELVGVGERLLEMTVEYTGQRVQFGRAIGSFQAVKHKCATMRVWLQASTAATYYAAMAVEAGTADPDRAVSSAKAFVSDAITQLAGEALQLHGGIGFTWEHDLHLYLRRAKSNALLFGNAAYHRERLCRLIETA